MIYYLFLAALATAVFVIAVLFHRCLFLQRENMKIRLESQRDCLTGLYNRSAAQGLIEKVLARSKPEAMHAMLVIDIDNFKNVNDLFGHSEGDGCLLSVCSALKSELSDSCFSARVGGDEFIVFIPNVKDYSAVCQYGERLCEKIRSCHGKFGSSADYIVSVSVGAAFGSVADGATYERLFETADYAMYVSKRSGKSLCTVMHL